MSSCELETIAPGRSGAVGVLRLTRIFASEDADSLRMTTALDVRRSIFELPPYFAGSDEEEAEDFPPLA